MKFTSGYQPSRPIRPKFHPGQMVQVTTPATITISTVQAAIYHRAASVWNYCITEITHPVRESELTEYVVSTGLKDPNI